MSSFAVEILPVAIEPHPNADAIELARLGDYLSVVKKGQFKSGDRVAYIPEAAILPAWLIEKLGLTGKLAGPEMNRVKALRLRGVLSQGICLQLDGENLIETPAGAIDTEAASNSDALTEALGIVKYVPEIPDCLKGDVYVLEAHETFKFDIDDVKRFPSVIQEGEPVSYTEKLHGVCTMVIGLPVGMTREPHYKGRAILTSKGLGGQGLAFAHTAENQANVYFRGASQILDKAIEAADWTGVPTAIFGEVYGSGVQDLSYGAKQGEVSFRAFAIRAEKRWFGDEPLEWLLKHLSIPRVPVLHKGPHSKALMLELTSGKTALGANQIREGLIVTPLEEREDLILGRVVLKSVSADYLVRKGGTEYA